MKRQLPPEVRSALPPQRSAAAILRHDRLLSVLSRQGTVRICELAGVLDVHPITVRRDLAYLEIQGQVETGRGAACLRRWVPGEISVPLRAEQQLESKRRIAALALKLVRDGETLAMDASTTCLALAKRLGGLDVRVITNGLDAATVLAELGVPVRLTGGAVRPISKSLVDIPCFKPGEVNTVFFSAMGVTRQGFTEVFPQEAEGKTALIRAGQRVVALLDHTKFGRTAGSLFARLEELDVLVTDHSPGAELLEELHRSRVRVIAS